MARTGEGEVAVTRRTASGGGLPDPGGGSRTLPVLTALPYAFMAVVATVDVVAGSSIGLLPLVSLGPAFSGLVGGWRRTALVGALAVAVCCALGIYDGL